MAEWVNALPKTSGRYWAWARDGDMMPVYVEVEGELTRVSNDANHTLGVIGPCPPWLTFERFEIVFSHFHPYTVERPEPPG